MPLLYQPQPGLPPVTAIMAHNWHYVAENQHPVAIYHHKLVITGVGLGMFWMGPAVSRLKLEDVTTLRLANGLVVPSSEVL